MRNLFVTICSIFFMALGAAAQTPDSTTNNNVNPDWVVKPQQKRLVSSSNTQKAKPEWTQKLRYGGNFWLSVFNGAYIEASPMVGYKLNENGTIAGVGLNLIYTNTGGVTPVGNFEYGTRLFLQQPICRLGFKCRPLRS
jgi:hypothetical protein